MATKKATKQKATEQKATEQKATEQKATEQKATKQKAARPRTKPRVTDHDEPPTFDAVWFLLPQQWARLSERDVPFPERLLRAVRVVEELAVVDELDVDFVDGAGLPVQERAAQERVRVETPLTLDEFERTWPDSRTALIDPWYGHGEVDRANAEARRWSARYLLRAVDGGR
jgi:hypothetical protein